VLWILCKGHQWTRVRPMTPWFDTDCRAARRRATAAGRRYRRLRRWRPDEEERDCHQPGQHAASVEDTSQRSWRNYCWWCGRYSWEICDFFTDKIASVRESTAATPLYDVPYKSTPVLVDWTTVTAEEVEKLIGSAPAKAYRPNPVPTWLVKDFRGVAFCRCAV